MIFGATTFSAGTHFVTKGLVNTTSFLPHTFYNPTLQSCPAYNFLMLLLALIVVKLEAHAIST
jgi:hypothetical protein